MEVHHHPKIEKKKFKEYFLEFLMIFLAVTMGFIAENIREHFADNQKEKQYLQSLYEDLKTDTASLANIINLDVQKTEALKNMFSCYDSVSKNVKATSCMNELLRNARSNWNFQQNDRTLLQLANAGGFRLLRKEDADSIIIYQNLCKTYHNFESTFFQQAQDNVRNTSNMLFNFKAYASILNPLGPTFDSTFLTGQWPLLYSDDKSLMNKWFNELFVYMRVTHGQMAILTRIREKATELIAYYKSKYHFEE